MALPRDIDLPTMPTLEAIAAPADGANELDLATLTRILFCANGLTRQRKVGGEDYHFRAAASAGALYPIETYIAAANVDGMETGLYHFSPADLKVQGLRRGDWREVIAHATANAALDCECARDSHHERDLLAQCLEVSRARVSVLLLGFRDHPGESARGGGGRRYQRRGRHGICRCGPRDADWSGRRERGRDLPRRARLDAARR